MERAGSMGTAWTEAEHYRLEGGPADQVKGSNPGPALRFRNYCLSFLKYKRKTKGEIPHRIVVTNKRAYEQKHLK